MIDRIDKAVYMLKDLKARQYGEEENNVIQVDCPDGVGVHANEVMFRENCISRIEIFRFDHDDSSSLHVNLLMGNLNVASLIFETSVVVQIYNRKSVDGSEYINRIHVREVRDYELEDN